MSRIEFLIPGDLGSLTGGYTYDRELVAAMRSAGIEVGVRQLEEDLTDADARASAAQLIEDLPDGARVLIDGLALADLADALAAVAHRLHLYALVHHPAALETGMPEADAARIAERELAALRKAERIVCTSNWTADELIGMGLPDERIRVVEPGVDRLIADSKKISNQRRAPATAFADGLQLICVATITPRKGHDILIAALSELQSFDWQLDCIGSLQRAPQHVKTIESLIEHHGLQDRIRMRGELTRDQLAAAYGRADLFVLASALEGYGMVFAEARAAALPIVATSGGATAQTLSGSGAVLVEDRSAKSLAHALRAPISDLDNWKKLAAAARTERGAPREWQAVAAEFVAALDGGPSS
jgi:glycosyltransferase involved in cell wall biosynthesis